MGKPSVKYTTTFEEVESFTLVTVKIAWSAPPTEVVTCLTPSIHSSTLEVSPAVNPLPAKVACNVFVAESKLGVREVTVA